MAEIDLKFMKGNKQTLKMMSTTYTEKPKNQAKKTVKKSPKK